jgi:hypothetical protein
LRAGASAVSDFLGFSGNGIRENLADKARKLGKPVVKFEKGLEPPFPLAGKSRWTARRFRVRPEQRDQAVTGRRGVVRGGRGGEQGGQQQGQEGPEVGEDLAEVVPAGAEE